MKISAIPIKAVTIYNHALDLTVKGDLNTALNEYKKAIDICPTFIEAYNNIGELYSRIGKNEMAISTYLKALRIDRNHRLLLNLGVEYYNDRDYKTAIGYFKESIIKKPDFLEGNFYTGLASFNLKDHDLAEQHFRNVVQLDNKHLKANYFLSYIYYDWKKYLSTLQHLDNIKDITEDKLFLNKYYGFCNFHLGNYNEAVKYLTTAIKESPKYEKFKYYLDTLTFENKVKEAGDVNGKIIEMEKMMLEKTPSVRELTQLNLLYIYKGEYKKAEDVLTAHKKN